MTWSYHPDLLTRPVPRYTSFPTAAEFREDVGALDMAEALDTVAPDAAISLYLHVPYCHDICWYCGCNTGRANRSGRLGAYSQRLGEEIDLVARQLAGRGRVARIAWGGGSPNALEPAQFAALMARVRDAFACDHAVVSIELDPRGFDAAWIDTLAVARVTRASLGVQTFEPALQAAIGRVQPLEDIERAVDWLRAAGVGSLNFDLMYGLPGQDIAALDRTLDTALSLGPDRLAVFGYAHVPHMIARQRQIDAAALPGAAARFEQARHAHDRLTGAEEWQPVGFDHFALGHDPLAIAARDGTLRRNFQGFTDDRADVLIGLGASSISQFPGALLQNEKNTGRYHLRIGNGGFATARGIHRSDTDRRRAAIIESLLCRGEAVIEGLPDRARVDAAIAPYAVRELAMWHGRRLVLAPDALPYARGIAAAIDPWRAQEGPRFSSAI